MKILTQPKLSYLTLCLCTCSLMLTACQKADNKTNIKQDTSEKTEIKRENRNKTAEK